MGGGFPCTLGSTAVFSSQEIRDEVSNSYHKYEYKTLDAWNDMDLTAYARLCFRIFSLIPKEQFSQIYQNVKDKKANSSLEKVLSLPVTHPPAADMLTLACLINFMMSVLEIHGYFDNKISRDDVIKILYR